MRVLIVTDQYAPMVGGVPEVTRTLANGLAQRGHSVTLLAPSPAGRGQRAAQGRVTVDYRGSVPWPWYPGQRLGLLPGPAGRRLLAGVRPEIVHIHSPAPLGVGAARAARRAGLPVVYTNHFLPVNVRPGAGARPRGFDTLFYRYLVGFSNRCRWVTAPTATALRLLRERGLRVPSEVITNGVDLREYWPGEADDRLRARYRLPPGPPLVLSVGRLSPEKRVGVLLGAAARLSQPAHLVIAGAGPSEGELRDEARRLGACRRISFLGYVPPGDLPGLYRLADVFAIASEAELQSLVTLEAMASGLPVVAARACALPELVEHEQSGYLVTPGSSQDMARGLDLILADRARQARMGARGIELARRHDLQAGLGQWERLYRSLAGTEMAPRGP